MTILTVVEAETQLSKLLDRAEAGEEITIARQGRPSVRLVPVGPAPNERPKQPIDLAELEALRNSLPPWTRPSADLIREMRDEGW